MPRETYSDREYRRQDALRMRLVDNLNSAIMSKCSQDAYINSVNRIKDATPDMSQTARLYVDAYMHGREDVEIYNKLLHAYRITGRPETATNAKYDQMSDELKKALKTSGAAESCLAWDPDGAHPYYGWKKV